jgi:hypothetical protein
MAQLFAKAALLPELNALLTGSYNPTPQEVEQAGWGHVLAEVPALLAGLPDGDYAVLGEATVAVLERVPVRAWGTADRASYVLTPAGAGLELDYGSSEGSSAVPAYVVPAGAVPADYE